MKSQFKYVTLSIAAALAIGGATANAQVAKNATDSGLVKIQFVASEPCALVMFINILADRHHTSTWVKDWYEKKCKLTPSLTKNLEAYKAPLDAYRKLIDR